MRTLQIAATAMLAITATIVTCTAASADPTRDTTIVAPITAGGTDHGVTYTMRRAGTDISLDITGGTIHSDTHDVTVTAADGTRIATLPVEMTSGGQQVRIANRIDGTHLAANISARDIGYWELTSPHHANAASAPAQPSVA